jgi:hypothetical protein
MESRASAIHELVVGRSPDDPRAAAAGSVSREENREVADRERDGDGYEADWPGPIDELPPLFSA